MIHTAEYWQDHFKAGLTYAGKDGGEDEWIGTDKQWHELTWIQDGVEEINSF